MNNEKIIEFYKKLEQDSNVKSNLKKKIQHVRNEDDLRKIIDNEIIPLSRKMGMSFTSDELMNYERHVSQVLNEIELENISGGASNKNLFLGGLVSLMFLGLSHLSTVQAVNLDQVIHTTRNQIESIEYSPDKTNETNPTNKPILSTPKTELMPSTEAIISTKNQQVPDQQQTTDLNQDAEVNPLKRPRLNQLPTDSTDITDSTKVQPELNQSQSTTTEETAITAQPANTVDGVDETYTVTTDTQEEQAGLNRKQVISATKELTDATQTTPDTTTPNPTTSDGTATVFWQNLINQLSNNKKLYCLEALNLCNPFIEKETEVIENVRLYNGYTNSIGIRGKSYTRNYSKDEGMGSANLMKILFPSTAGELNITTTSDSITTLNECEPSPEDIANLMVCLFKYRNNDPETVVRFTLLNKWKEFGEGFVRGKYNILKGSNPPTYDYDGFFKRTLSKNSTFAKQYKGVLIDIKEKLSKITDRDSRKKQLYYDLLNYEGETTVEKEKITTFFSIIQNAIYMIDNQEKNDRPEENENIRIFPKYAAERFILSYFIDKFDKDEQITAFYSKIIEQLNNLSLPNERNITEKELNSAKKRLEETLPVLNKYSQNKFSPYKKTTVQNGTCYSIQQENDKISFGSVVFADCADTAVRHVMNLLIYSQGINKNLTDPWADILPKKGSDQEIDIQHKLNEVTNAIKNKGTQVPLYPLKDRLQMFFLHQKEVGTDKADSITRTLWEYVIYNLTEENNGFAPLTYNKTKYELDSGYKNMLTLMCRCAQELFPEKDVKAAYEKVIKCPEYEYNQNLSSAIEAVFKLFNESNYDIIQLEGGIKITYPELGNLNFSIFQNRDHASTDHVPSTMKPLTEQEINAVKESKNDFTTIFVNFLLEQELEIREDFYKLFLEEGLEYNYNKKFNLALSSDKVINSKFLIRYQILKFLASAQGEENNSHRISNLLQTYRITASKLRSCLDLQIDEKKVNISDFIFDRYIDASNFDSFSDSKNAFEIIDSTNQVSITSFGNNLGLAQENTITTFRYALNENGNAILYPIEDKENLYIPSTITIGKNKIKVAGLGNLACYNFKVLSKVIIENTENEAESTTDFKIGKSTFQKCSNLKSITLHHKNLKNLNIENYAFCNCTNFKSFDFSSNKELENIFISNYAFYNCTNFKSFDFSSFEKLKNIFIGNYAFNESELQSIVLPENMENLYIGNYAFYECMNFEGLDLSSKNKLENIFIGSFAFTETAISSIIIPINVKILTIGESAFYNCKNLLSFNLSLNVNLKRLCIGKAAFMYSTINSVIMPKNINELIIGNSAFSYCHNLTIFNLSLSNGLENFHIGSYALRSTAITTITIPITIKNLTIEQCAFEQCSLLESLDLSSNVKLEKLYIGYQAFANSATSSVVMPKNLKVLVVYRNAFSNCNKFKSFDISSLNNLEELSISLDHLDPESRNLLDIPKSVKILYLDGIVLPNSDFSMFEKLEELSIDFFEITNQLVIPESVKTLKVKCVKSKSIDLSMYEKVETLCIGGDLQRDTSTTLIPLPKNVKSLTFGEESFCCISNLKNLDLSPYKNIEKLCFQNSSFNYTALEKIIFPENVKTLTIESCVFGDCKSLKRVTIPQSLIELNIDLDHIAYDCIFQIPEHFKYQLKDKLERMIGPQQIEFY